MSNENSEKRVPAIRFKGFTDAWEQRTLGELYKSHDERNTVLLDERYTLSVASMTYRPEGNGAQKSSLANYKLLREGDVAFEGHTSSEFRYGRFVVNDTGIGIMSPRFRALRPTTKRSIQYWKYFIHNERIMRPLLVRATKSGTMMNELVEQDLFSLQVSVPNDEEQKKIGTTFQRLDSLITLHQRLRRLISRLLHAIHANATMPQALSVRYRTRFTVS